MKGPLKNAILASCAGLLLAFSALAADPANAADAANAANAASGPKAVAVEPIADVGTVPKGEKIVHDFVIQNQGNAPLQITEVRPACGCTVADFDKTIAPGQSGKIHVVIDSSTFNAPSPKG